MPALGRVICTVIATTILVGCGQPADKVEPSRSKVIHALLDYYAGKTQLDKLDVLKPYLPEHAERLPEKVLEKAVFERFDAGAPQPHAGDAVQIMMPSDGAKLDVRLFTDRARKNTDTLFILTHGTPKSGVPRLQYDHYGYLDTIRALYPYADVAFVYRMGAGDTEQGLSEHYGNCDAPDYQTPTMNAVRHLQDAASFLRKAFGYKHLVLLGQSSGGLAAIAAAAQENGSGYDMLFAFNPGRGQPREGQWCPQESLRALVYAWTHNLQRPLILMFSDDDEQMALPDAKAFYQSLPAEILFYKTPPAGPAHALLGLWSGQWLADVLKRAAVQN
ncbi:MAG: hypothetical protein GC134_02020 [Proteobacteria bacterium]|nr:hypothetical protein [Pseudomonadota bacterium]